MTQAPASPSEGTQNGGLAIITVFAVTLAIAILLLAARLYVRARILKKLWIDDFFTIIGVIIAIVTFALINVAIHAGLGRHLATLTKGQISRITEFQTLAQFAVGLSIMFTRLSICLLLLRFSAGAGQKWFPTTIYCIMGVIVITNVSSQILTLTVCRPVQRIWTPSMPGTCWSQRTHYNIGLYNGGENTAITFLRQADRKRVIAILCDFTLAILPTFYLWNVQISPRIKISICCLMGVGILPGICAILRTALHNRLFLPDFTYNAVEGVIWAVLECDIAIIAACIPTLKPLGKILRSSIRSLRSRSSRNDRYFNQIEDAHHLTRLQASRDPHTGRKGPQSPVGTRAEVQGPGRYAITKSDRSSISEQNINGIKTKTAFHVTDEKYEPGVQSYDNDGRLVRGPGIFD